MFGQLVYSTMCMTYNCIYVITYYYKSHILPAAIFSSLQQGADIDCHDIEAAINNICEESTPLEIDITHFVYSVCGHVRQLIEKVNLARIVQEDIMKTFPKSMSKDDDTSAATDEASHAE